MSTPLFGRTQSAIQTPFEPLRNPGFGGLAQPFVSTDVQNAIEEGLSQAIANDKFLVLAHYGGNANVGRNLEFYPNDGSDVGPIFLTTASKIVSVTLQTTAATATCTVGIFNLTVSSVTPIYTVVMTAVKRVSYTSAPATPLAVAPAGALLSMRVTSGSINTPESQLTFSSSI